MPELLLCLSSSSSVVLTRLSGPHGIRVAEKILIGEPQGKTLSGRAEDKTEGNIELNLKVAECEGADKMPLVTPSK
jgi:hypothetical protein